MSGPTRSGPGRIALPTNVWHDDSALLTDTPSSARDQSAFSPSAASPRWFTRRDSIQNPFNGDEPPEIPDKPPIPVALPMTSVAGVTPLPILPMTVLSIVCIFTSIYYNDLSIL